MHPELFEIPFTDITVKSYGVMLVIGFLAGVGVMRHMARRSGQDPERVTNVGLYALIWGVIGCRIFYVIHNFDQFRDNLWEVFAVWQGGLEFLGGVFLAIVFITVYKFLYKIPLRVYFDFLAVGLMVGLGFGRIGCFLNSCCFGEPCELPWAVEFPYGSHPYESQVRPDASRNRDYPHLELPADYFGFPNPMGEGWVDAEESNKYYGYLKPFDELTEQQQEAVTRGEYQSLPVHPTQLYSSLNAFVLCGVLYLFWLYFGRYRPGATFTLMFVLYGVTRFFIEFIREGNPFEYGWWTLHEGWTISQNLGLYLAMAGALLFVYFVTRKPVKLAEQAGQWEGGETPAQDEPEKTAPAGGQKETDEPEADGKKEASRKKAAVKKTAKKKTARKKTTKKKTSKKPGEGDE